MVSDSTAEGSALPEFHHREEGYLPWLMVDRSRKKCKRHPCLLPLGSDWIQVRL